MQHLGVSSAAHPAAQKSSNILSNFRLSVTPKVEIPQSLPGNFALQNEGANSDLKNPQQPVQNPEINVINPRLKSTNRSAASHSL